MEKKVEKIDIRHAEFAFKPNFSGKRSDINPHGFRQFTIIIPLEIVDRLVEDGWNIKWKKLPYGRWMEGDPLTPTLDVAVRPEEPYRSKIYMIKNGKKYPLYDDDMNNLDDCSFENIDMVIRPRLWKSSEGDTRVKANLEYLWASGLKSSLCSEYMDIPMAED